MEKKILFLSLIILSVIFFLGISSASLGNIEKGKCADIKFTSNCSAVNLTYVASPVETFVINSPMNKLGGQSFNSTFCDTSTLGKYSFCTNPSCSDCSDGKCCDDFYVTINGKDKADGIFLIFIYLVCIISFIGLIYFFFYIIATTATYRTNLFNVLISWGFYVLAIAGFYLSGFMIDDFLRNLMDLTIKISAFSNVVFPIISFIIAIFVKSFTKLKPIQMNDAFGFGGAQRG